MLQRQEYQIIYIGQNENYSFEYELKMKKISSGLNNPNVIHLIGHGWPLIKGEMFIIMLISII